MSFSQPRGKGAVLLIVGALIGVIGYTHVYLPRYSPEAEAGRRRSAGRGGSSPDLAPGSVWKNMAAQRDGLRSSSTAEHSEGEAGRMR